MQEKSENTCIWFASVMILNSIMYLAVATLQRKNFEIANQLKQMLSDVWATLQVCVVAFFIHHITAHCSEKVYLLNFFEIKTHTNNVSA